jgi:hypothetical protein
MTIAFDKESCEDAAGEFEYVDSLVDGEDYDDSFYGGSQYTDWDYDGPDWDGPWNWDGMPDHTEDNLVFDMSEFPIEQEKQQQEVQG